MIKLGTVNIMKSFSLLYYHVNIPKIHKCFISKGSSTKSREYYVTKEKENRYITSLNQ